MLGESLRLTVREVWGSDGIQALLSEGPVSGLGLYGQQNAVLYCIVLYCIVLYCIVLAAERSIDLYCIVLYCIVLRCIALSAEGSIAFYCIVLYCIVLYCFRQRKKT